MTNEIEDGELAELARTRFDRVIGRIATWLSGERTAMTNEIGDGELAELARMKFDGVVTGMPLPSGEEWMKRAKGEYEVFYLVKALLEADDEALSAAFEAEPQAHMELGNACAAWANRYEDAAEAMNAMLTRLMIAAARTAEDPGGDLIPRMCSGRLTPR